MLFERCPVGVKRVESKRGKVVYRARTRKGGQNFSASFHSLEEAMAFLEDPNSRQARMEVILVTWDDNAVVIPDEDRRWFE